MHPVAHTYLAGTYDFGLVCVSVVIAIMAAYAALDLGERVTAARGRLRLIWLSGGAFAMGTGVWSMHYVGMLAYTLPVPVLYHWPTVLVSFAAAVLAAAIALTLVGGDKLTWTRIALGGLLMGCGIASMHYIGMEAMRLRGMCHYSPSLVFLSFLLAVAISIVALLLTFRYRIAERSRGIGKTVSAVFMGCAIPVMHYTGMAAVRFSPIEAEPNLNYAVEISSLGVAGIVAVTLVLLSLTIVTSVVDRRLSSQALELERSEQRYRLLVDTAKVVLWRATQDMRRMRYINQEGEDLFGYSLDEWRAAEGLFHDLVHPEDRSLVEAMWSTALRSGEPQISEHRMVGRGGLVVWLRASVRPVYEGGPSAEFVGVMTDITERKRAQEVAEEASRARGELLSEIKRLNDKLSIENSRMSSELDVTRRLQRMLLPGRDAFTRIPELEIAAYVESAAEVGGDYFDVIRDPDGVFLGIGDVTGHGLESGVIGIVVHTAVRTLLAAGLKESADFFRVLNRVVYETASRIKSDRNLTMSMMRYHSGSVRVSGQHEEIVVVRSNGTVERHDTLNLGFPLGLQPDITHLIGEAEFPLDSGDVMVVYTDGITEATNAAGTTYGIARLAEAVRCNHRKPAKAIRECVLTDVRDHLAGQPVLDDMSLLVVKPAAPGVRG